MLSALRLPLTSVSSDTRIRRVRGRLQPGREEYSGKPPGSEHNQMERLEVKRMSMAQKRRVKEGTTCSVKGRGRNICKVRNQDGIGLSRRPYILVHFFLPRNKSADLSESSPR